jgi:hypothetical protein
MLSDACTDALTAGVTTCIVLDTETGRPLGGGDDDDTYAARAILDILVGRVPVANATQDADLAPGSGALRELLVVGPQRAVFATLTRGHRRFALLVAPSGMSVALVWSLLRRIAVAAEGSP